MVGLLLNKNNFFKKPKKLKYHKFTEEKDKF